MRPEVIDYVLAKFEAELTSAVDGLSGELDQMRRRKQELEREIANLANFVAQGDCSPGLRAALVDREREIGDITEKLFEARPDSLQTKLRNIRALVESPMTDIRALRKLQSSQAGNTTWHQQLGIWLAVAVSMVPGARHKRNATYLSRLK